jgi:hypothetical protein
MITEKTKRIRLAVVKYGGLSSGGTEKFLQNVALNLDQNRFYVEYWYCDTSPYIGSEYQHLGTDSNIKQKFENSHVSIKEFHVQAKDVRTRTHEWIGSDFFELFDQRNFDVVLTGRAGHKEYPFYKLKRVPIVDSIHFNGGVDNQSNVAKVLFLSEESKARWVLDGGDAKRAQLVSHPLEPFTSSHISNLRSQLGIKSKWVLGMHQRDAEEIFSPIPIDAFRRLRNKYDVSFVMLGGSSKYRNQASGDSDIFFIPSTSDREVIHDFLNLLDIYTHGRRDGEINSTAIAEAMSVGLPVVSHIGTTNNGHIDQIASGGKVCDSIDEYVAEIENLIENEQYLKNTRTNSSLVYKEKYEIQSQMNLIQSILEDASKLGGFFSLRLLKTKNFVNSLIARVRRFLN